MESKIESAKKLLINREQGIIERFLPPELRDEAKSFLNLEPSEREKVFVEKYLPAILHDYTDLMLLTKSQSKQIKMYEIYFDMHNKWENLKNKSSLEEIDEIGKKAYTAIDELRKSIDAIEEIRKKGTTY